MQHLHRTSPSALISSLVANRALLRQMVVRDISSKYRGASLGLIWSIITPLILLAVYTFIFTVVFQAKWQEAGVADNSHSTNFALFAFLGLICFNFFAECVVRAPGLLTANVNLVKKVIFPLEIFPFIVVGSAFFHFLVNLLIFASAFFFVFKYIPIGLLLVPLVLSPLVLLICGLIWLLSSLGVFLRDIGQIIQPLITVLMLLSPIFYPVSALPQSFQAAMHLNPLTFVIESMRRVVFAQQPVDMFYYLLYCLLSLMVFLIGFVWFQKSRRLFADVI